MEVDVGGAPVDPVDDLDGSAPGALRCLREGGLDVLVDNAGACLVGQVGTSVLTAGECHGTRLPSVLSLKEYRLDSADESGGWSFFVDGAGGLPGVIDGSG